MVFEAYEIPTDAGIPGQRSSQPVTSSKHILDQSKTVKIEDEEGAQPSREAKRNPSPNKAKTQPARQQRVKKVATTHPSVKRQRGESQSASLSVEDLWIQLGLKLKALGKVGPNAFDRFRAGSPSRVARLKDKLREAQEESREKEKKNQEMATVMMNQTQELANLSKMVRSVGAENTRLKEENSRLKDEISKLREALAQKERDLPARALAWLEENKVEAARALTASPEATIEFFKFLYREPQGKKMITAVGSYGFKCGQKRDRAATHRILATRDPDFSAAAYGLPPIPEEEPAPPFPLD
ncbi:unnamed protein product [Cuscuta campestris]|uniref:Uncharacterized protein n=1 Tax=Cuscuta campestris TaxID=132261 RepID=A0A484KJ83_9ASTE|nr:unnamed protein product [Cuscuta campestris]